MFQWIKAEQKGEKVGEKHVPLKHYVNSRKTPPFKNCIASADMILTKNTSRIILKTVS